LLDSLLQETATMEDDRVEYWIYPTEDGLDSLTTLAQVWRVVEDSVKTFLWNQQLFNLKIVQEKDSWHLYGSVRYGDSVQDEWMVVALLKFITSKLDNMSARVTDSDGEIILIEAADQVPRWAGEPALAEGRVFLFNGEVHLLPVCVTPGDVTPFPAGTPDPAAAAAFISAYPHLSRAKENVQQCISARLGGLPLDVADNHHTTSVLLPPLLAATLGTNKQHVCDIINGLRDRDHIDLRNTRNMTRVRPTNRSSYSLTFPKCLYALVSSIDVRPHRCSGWEVDEKVKEDLLGYKLSLGLEIILSRHRAEKQSTEGNIGWENFIKKLNDVGYFQGELEGSAKHNCLLENAREFLKGAGEDSHHSRLDVLVDTVQRYEGGTLTAPPTGWLPKGGKEGDEAWMEITPESLDKMLAARFGVPQGGENNIPGELSSFLSKFSDMAGVDDKDQLDFDPSNLVDSMKKLLGENGGKFMGQNGAFNQDMLDSDIEDSSDEDGDNDEEDPVIVDYMSRLDAEVDGSVKGRDDIPDQDKPLEIDSSVLSNLLASYQAELGMSGPASSILNTLGINPGLKD